MNVNKGCGKVKMEKTEWKRLGEWRCGWLVNEEVCVCGAE